jgi:methylated-DNA-protein-cysteine methyltransferase-like protein
MKSPDQLSNSYERIWRSVRRIPKGMVATYGGIANASGLPRQARLVGYALHNLPLNFGVPWHRVINSQGKISLPKNGGHHERQRRLLEGEGIVFLKDRIDLKRYEWPARPTKNKSHKR